MHELDLHALLDQLIVPLPRQPLAMLTVSENAAALTSTLPPTTTSPTATGPMGEATETASQTN